MIRHAAAFAAVILFTVNLLALNVSLRRLKERKQRGGSEALERAVRLHLNNLEHGLPFSLLLVLFEALGGQATRVVGFGATYLLARVIHATGFMRRGGVLFRLHIVGAGLTYVLLAKLAVGVLLQALV